MADSSQSDDDDDISIDLERSQDMSDQSLFVDPGRNPLSRPATVTKQTPAQKRKARQSYLASHKVIEKKRRDRINISLQQLKDMVPDCSQYGNGKKLDKAEILESTIGYIKRLQRHSSGSNLLAEVQYGNRLKQVFNQLIVWTQDNWQGARSVESFAEQLLRKINSTAANEEAETRKGNVIMEKVEPLGSVMCPVQPGQRHPLIMTPSSSTANLAIAVPPVLRPSSNSRSFDPLAPPLLPVVPPMQPRQGQAFPTQIFPSQSLRIANPNSLPEQEHIFWQQQALLMQPVRQQPTPLSAIVQHPTSMPPQPSPPIIFHQSDANILMSEARLSEAPPVRRVTFPQTSESIEDGYPSRPKRLFLGAANSGNSSAVTPSTPHAGNYSTVSTPHGANTPGGEATPIGICSPTVAKPFPEPYRGHQLGESMSMQSPGVQQSPLTSPRPTPRSLSLGHMNPLSPNQTVYSRTHTAITPQRQIYAHSLLELAQHGNPPNSQALSQDLDSGEHVDVMTCLPGPGLQAPPLLATNDDTLQRIPDIGTPSQAHMNASRETMLSELNSQHSNILPFPPQVGLPMSVRGAPAYNQMDQSLSAIPQTQPPPALPPNTLPIGESTGSENILTTPCDPNMGAPPNLSVAGTEEDLDMVAQSRASHAPNSQPWSRGEGSEDSNPDHEMSRPQSDSADSLLVLSGQRTV